MPKLKGRAILSSDYTLASPTSPGSPRGSLSNDEEASDVEQKVPLPSLHSYLRGGVGIDPNTPAAPSPFGTPTTARCRDSLPGSSPIPTSPLQPSSPAIPSALPPLSSDGLIPTSPLVGTREERKVHAIQKGHRRRLETLANNKSAETESSEANKVEVFEEILEKLSSHGLSFGQLMLYVFDPVYKKGLVRWEGFFKHEGMATTILNLWTSNKNSPTARAEVGTWAEDYVAETMREEGRDITESKMLQAGSTSIDHKYVTSFSILGMGTYLHDAACVSMKMLAALATSSRNLKANLQPRAAKRFTIITSAALSLLGEFSHKNNFSRRIMGLYLYATGAQRQTISVMSHLGISESYQSLTHKSRIMIQRRPRAVNPDNDPPPPPPSTPYLKKTIKPGTLQELSGSMRSFARAVASTGLFAASYDNINLVFRAAEQVMGRTDSQENGTCSTIFPLWKAAAENMRIADLNAAFDAAPPLSIDDILLTAPEMAMMDKCLRHCILRIIVEHGGEKFKRFCDEVEKSLPVTPKKIELHQTPLHPLPAWDIDESTIVGNAEVAAAIYKELEVKGLSHWKWIVKILAGGYSGFGWGVWMPGLFHGKIADMHGFFVTHWGVPHRGTRNPGSLSFHNTHLHRLPILLTSLPPFRICRDLVFVSLYARILHCLLLVSGKSTLEDCANSITSFAQLESYAARIQTEYANAEVVSKLRWDRKMAHGTDGAPPGDEIFENASLLLRDAIISREFTDSIKAGDSGRIVLVVKLLALGFRGNGRSKYPYEMLHLIHNLTHVWPKPIRDIVLNNWLVNPTGNPFSWVEVDLMQEHMNFWIKTIYQAHGSAASWDWLGMVAPCITALRHLSTSIVNILGSDQGTKHAPADLTTDIELLMDSLSEHDVYKVKGRVFADGDGAPTPDVISVGIQQLTDSTSNPLTEYNAAFQKLQARRRLQPLVSMSPPSAPTTSPCDDAEMHNAEDSSDSGSDESSDSEFGGLAALDFEGEALTAFEHLMDQADEPTLTRNNADDIALDMDGGDNGFGLAADPEDLYGHLHSEGFIVDDVNDLDYYDSY
ncbi:hypothetical protein B0H17DRAFT_1260445 [Mycena rosella]|uniref:DUF6589 domain-containing protein n=1 Tax=Mycena rosella TaxID=1033263 RepID=A0AAD7G6D2_MYCRO|nr:hypothetical protein B0H17DRAFT_1260445 [Mycena rosella]